MQTQLHRFSRGTRTNTRGSNAIARVSTRVKLLIGEADVPRTELGLYSFLPIILIRLDINLSKKGRVCEGRWLGVCVCVCVCGGGMLHYYFPPPPPYSYTYSHSHPPYRHTYSHSHSSHSHTYSHDELMFNVLRCQLTY